MQPFPVKLYGMLEHCAASRASDPRAAASVSWVAGGRAFAVRDRDAFLRHVVPRFFKQTKFRSFVSLALLSLDASRPAAAPASPRRVRDPPLTRGVVPPRALSPRRRPASSTCGASRASPGTSPTATPGSGPTSTWSAATSSGSRKSSGARSRTATRRRRRRGARRARRNDASRTRPTRPRRRNVSNPEMPRLLWRRHAVPLIQRRVTLRRSPSASLRRLACRCCCHSRRRRGLRGASRCRRPPPF